MGDVMGIKHVVGLGVLALVGYDRVVRPRLLDWGSTPDERSRPLPGDEIVTDVVPAAMGRHTRAVTIDAPPEAIWPWLVQIGDRRAGFYSYDWFERATGTVHYIEGRHSAARIHPELQDLKVGDRIDTGSIGPDFRIGSPVTVLEPNRALVMGTWAFVLDPLAGGRTRLLVREAYPGLIRLAVPVRFGLLRAIGAAIDYAVGEPLHFVMERKMMLGLKQRAEGAATQPPTSAGRRGDDRVTR